MCKFLIPGDSGYPLEPWLMTTIMQPQQMSHRMYTCHAKTRNTIERTFGVLKSRFRCIRKDRLLGYSPLTAVYIKNVCAVLHNVCIKNSVPEPEEIFLEDEENDVEVQVPRSEHHSAGVNVHNIILQTVLE